MLESVLLCVFPERRLDPFQHKVLRDLFIPFSLVMLLMAKISQNKSESASGEVMLVVVLPVTNHLVVEHDLNVMLCRTGPIVDSL